MGPTVIDIPSPNHGPRRKGAGIAMVVLHYTGMVDAAAALARLCDPAAEVSAHYLIDEDGTIHRLVAEERRAWHAGAGFWRGCRDVNSASIGIELVNPGHDWGYRPFAGAQMAALLALLGDIRRRHAIAADMVLAHSDIAATRKADPGELFDWQRLARAGLALWPQPEAADDGPAASGEVPALLARYGYDPAVETKVALTAFQRHFHPEAVTGEADPETLRRLRALVRQAGR